MQRSALCPGIGWRCRALAEQLVEFIGGDSRSVPRPGRASSFLVKESVEFPEPTTVAKFE